MIIKTTHITQSAAGDKNGLWTSTVAAAVLFPVTYLSNLPQGPRECSGWKTLGRTVLRTVLTL